MYEIQRSFQRLKLMSRHSVLQKLICSILVITLVPGSIYANTSPCMCRQSEDDCCCETDQLKVVKQKKSCCASKTAQSHPKQLTGRTNKGDCSKAIDKNKNAHFIFVNCNCLSNAPAAPLALNLSQFAPELVKALLSYHAFTFSTDTESGENLHHRSSRHLLDQSLHQCTAENVQSLQCIWLI